MKFLIEVKIEFLYDVHLAAGKCCLIPVSYVLKQKCQALFKKDRQDRPTPVLLLLNK